MELQIPLTIYGDRRVTNPFASHSDDDLADSAGHVIREIERRIEASDHPDKAEMGEHAEKAHRQLNKIGKLLKTSGLIQPMSGGSKTD